MHDNDALPPPFSETALHVMGLLVRCGGSVRTGPLREVSGLDRDALAAAIDELDRRCWIEIVWRGRAGHRDADDTRPLGDIRRIVATRFGKCRYAVTWE